LDQIAKTLFGACRAKNKRSVSLIANELKKKRRREREDREGRERDIYTLQDSVLH
jgi:hypothetical protein